MRSRYKCARDAAGLRDVKFHGLRHAAGAVMARSMPPVSVRDILGHSKIETTDRYLHSQIDAAAVAAVNAAGGRNAEGGTCAHRGQQRAPAAR
jgi:integrase